MAKSFGHTVIGFLGSTLDRGNRQDRWERWRPSVSVCQHEDLLVDRFVLLVDDRYTQIAERVRDDILLVSPETSVEFHTVNLRNAWDFEEVFSSLHDFARAFAWRPEHEDYLVHITTGTHVAQICLFLLTETRHLPARLIQTSPPDRKQRDPIGTFQIIDLDLSRYDQIATRHAREHDEGVSLLKSGIDTRNREFNRQIDEIEKVANVSTAPILLMGPTGAGKSQLASRIAELRRSRHQLEGPFVEVNCATLRGDQAHSTLFGHKKGAFTGAASDRAGLLKTADQGLLFLDEIGELGLDEQAMLLRALEEKRFLPLGADTEIESDFQLIAGTNRDLGEHVAKGLFREDLLARINLWTFRLPGLRDRIEDLEPNLDYELDRFSTDTGRKIAFNKEARKRYLEFATGGEGAWLGNFRDLNASITRLGTLSHGGRINAHDVRIEIDRLRADWRRDAPGKDDGLEELLGEDAAEALDLFDRVQLAEVVRVCRRSKSLSEAGRTLFAASLAKKASKNDADRLRKYLGKFGVSFGEIVG